MSTLVLVIIIVGLVAALGAIITVGMINKTLRNQETKEQKKREDLIYNAFKPLDSSDRMTVDQINRMLEKKK